MDPFIKEYENEPIKTQIINNISNFNNIHLNKQHNYKILHINIRSISKNIDELAIFLNQLSLNFEIIVLTETHYVYDPQIFKLDGYNILYNEGTLNRNDGVIVLIKPTLRYTYNIVNIGEIRALQLNVTKNEKNFIITAIYRSPSTCPKNFNIQLLKYMDGIKGGDMHIIVGDINIDILSDNDYIEEYKNIMSAHGFISYINKHTRPQSKTCLDHFFIKSSLHNDDSKIRSYIFEYDITDHYPIAVTFEIDKMADKKNNLTSKQKYKKYINYANLKSDLRQEKWRVVYEENNVDIVTNAFIETLNHYIKKNTNEIKINHKNIHRKQWISSGLVKSINEKNKLYTNLQKDPNNKNLIDAYKIYKNKLKQLIQKAKKNYFKSLINKNKNSSKALWDCVNDICSKSQPKTIINNIKLTDGCTTENKQEISDAFNQHYSDLGKTYASKIINPPENFTEKNIHIENTMYLHLTNEMEVLDIIKELKPKKSPGFDNIRSEVIKEVAKEISKPLTSLINKCFENECFPKPLKDGIIKPLYKSGEKLEIINYRPISLISSIAKIIEKILKRRITKFLDKHKIISNHQYGFREGRSTEDAILKLTSHLYKALDSKTPALCIFVDLSKAFDTVSHKKLLEKIKCYGLRGKVYNILKSYLSNREQYVEIDGTLSSSRTITYGVPQGTVLGPLLFTIYINSLLHIDTAGTILSFADDTAILYTEKTWELLKTKTESDFKKIQQWFQYNKLTLNCDKTKYLPFTSYANNLPNLGPLSIDQNQQIPEAESIKYLGIIIDRHLRWDLQILNLIKKVRGLLTRFKYLQEYLEEKQLKILYYSLVQSQISYGIAGWGGVKDNHLEKLNTVQKWILKIIYNKKRTYPSDTLFKETNTLDIRQLFCLNMLLNIKRNKIKVQPIHHHYQTREKQHHYSRPRSDKTIGQRNCNYLGPRLYETLPSYIKNIKNLKLFKAKVKKWLLDNERILFHDIINQRNK